MASTQLRTSFDKNTALEFTKNKKQLKQFPKG